MESGLLIDIEVDAKKKYLWSEKKVLKLGSIRNNQFVRKLNVNLESVLKC